MFSILTILNFYRNAGQKETVDLFGSDHPYTCLVIKNEGDIDPDDSFSRIPYEKGFSILYYLQSIFGVEKFEGFLKENDRKNLILMKIFLSVE